MQPAEGLFTRQLPGIAIASRQTRCCSWIRSTLTRWFQALTDLTLNIGVGSCAA